MRSVAKLFSSASFSALSLCELDDSSVEISDFLINCFMLMKAWSFCMKSCVMLLGGYEGGKMHNNGGMMGTNSLLDSISCE